MARPTTRRSVRAALLAAAAAVALLAPAAASARPAAAAADIPPGERLNASAAAVVRTFLSFDNPPIPALQPRNARAIVPIQRAAEFVAQRRGVKAIEPVASIRHRVFRGPGGQTLVRIYRPAGRGPFPVIVYYHGGGWTIADPNVYDASARALTNASRHIVVSVRYRQAPEFKFPAAVNDAYAALRWTQRNAASFGGIPTKVAVAGESAGGNLAAVASLAARDNGTQLPTFQLLVYPITNYAFTTRSYIEKGNNVPLDRPTMQYFWRQYLRRPADGRNPYASPLRAPSLAGLPPALVITAENDPLRDEGEAYAARLRAAGVPVQATRYNRVMHEFFGMPAVIPQARQAVAQAGAALRAVGYGQAG